MKSLRILINILFAIILLPCAMFVARGIQSVYRIVSMDAYHRDLLSSAAADTTPGLVMMMEAILAAAAIVVVRKLLFVWLDRQNQT